MNYYNEKAREFFQGTINVDMRSLYSKFLPQLRHGDLILDAGCGSGRDSKYFLSNGFRVHAIDASKELAKLAEIEIGQSVEVTTFAEFSTDKEFDAIWACASLIHVPFELLPDSISNLDQYLKIGGLFYCSFKFGCDEVERGGRSFTNLNEELLDQALLNSSLRVSKTWVTGDARKGREEEKWLNAILVKER
ncbi:methyltransferase domain-containing protein [Vibrio toranzoniae]|uniref:class I SAM-dependent methyltransferase n=1 Tax=Vibrio toranzoniae TaxID=1194427 RepID=UPI0013784587|nr:class I SAM-dependent methyltransferase [Vibrio toranzoniae]NAZ53261.1 methyltransferase domain-containing protein [Vibrio toranzoniae]